MTVFDSKNTSVFHIMNRKINGAVAWMMDPPAKLRYERDVSTNIRRRGFRMQYFVVSGLDTSGT